MKKQTVEIKHVEKVEKPVKSQKQVEKENLSLF